MSKNPAWNAYNEKHREIKANEAYEDEIKPIRAALSSSLAETERRINPKIEALVEERTTIVDKLKSDYADKVHEIVKERNAEVARAHKVLNAELDAAKLAKV